MPLARGTRLGPYEILAPLGAGGMGEVWRARDTRLARDVALKVLPDHLSDDPKALARLENEAKAVAALSHPHILAIHDFGRADGVSFAVTELLEGETLRAALRHGPLGLRKSLDVAAQLADALAAAHEKEIVHRDVKPENVFLTKDGRAKLLDFGLARHDSAFRSPDDTHSPTVTRNTDPGTILGTVSYMSPEQAQGRPAGFRSDQFSLGVVLYGMLSGKRPFQGPSPAETLAAIIHTEPEPLGTFAPSTPTPVRWIVDRLLAKDPAERYASTRDLATFQLHLSEAATGAAPTAAPPRRAHRFLLVATSALLAAIALGGVFLLKRGPSPQQSPTFRKLTFGKGSVGGARFTPDGSGIVYAARWEDRKTQLFSARLDAPAVAVPLEPAGGVAVGTSGGQIAVLVPRTAPSGGEGAVPTARTSRVLATIPHSGGTPRPLLDDILAADWSSDGTAFAVVRSVEGRTRLEFPPGKVLYDTSGLIRSLNVAPGGGRIAFAHWPGTGGMAGAVHVAEAETGVVKLSDGWASVSGVHWSPDGADVWFTAGRTWGWKALHAATLDGRVRSLLQVPTDLTLQDVHRDGRVLVTSGAATNEVWGRGATDAAERSHAWLDGSGARGISADGRSVLLGEYSVGGGAGGSVWLRRLDGTAPFLLGMGVAFGLSPDGKWAITRAREASAALLLVPTGPGEGKTLPRGTIDTYHGASFFPDGRRVLIAASEAGRPQRLLSQDREGALPRVISPEGFSVPLPSDTVSPDGARIAAFSVAAGEGPVFVSVEDGTVRSIDGLGPGDVPLAWTRDGKSLFVREPPTGSAWRVVRFDLESRKRTLWKELRPAEPSGTRVVYNPVIARDGEVYLYTVFRQLTNLFLVEGLR
jgi:hypothetical protein